jgi:hypothetical protein
MVEVSSFAASLLLSDRIHAQLLLYTDPGTGSLVWQLVLASVVGGGFYARLLLRQVRERFTSSKKVEAAARVSLGDQSSEAIK